MNDLTEAALETARAWRAFKEAHPRLAREGGPATQAAFRRYVEGLPPEAVHTSEVRL